MNESKYIGYDEIYGTLAENLVNELHPVGNAVYKDNIVSVYASGDGIMTNSFFANGNMVKIVAELEGDIESVNIWLVIVKEDNSEERYKILDGTQVGLLELTFDAANYIVYSKAKSFKVIIDTGCNNGNFRINRLKICELNGMQQSVYYDEKFEYMMKKIMDSLDLLHSASVPQAPSVVSASGEKYTLGVDCEGKLFAILNIPSNVVCIGNSLLFGMGSYGMCAGASDKDYFHYVKQAILEKNPNASFSKLYGSGFEMGESAESFETWWNTEINDGTGKTAKESFQADTDLVIIQLGDNVNTPGRAKGLAENIETLIRSIKERSPKARLIWVLGWYNRANSYGIVSAAAARWNIPVVDISDLNIKENQGYSGQKYMLADGSVGIVRDGWITHPGDKGMYIIAERIIRAINM